jgi:hypothetical protein
MRKPSTTALRRKGKLQNGQLTIGLDLGDRSSFYCVLNGAGEVVLEAKVATNPEAMKKTFEKMPPSRIALETGTHSLVREGDYSLKWISAATKCAFLDPVPRLSIPMMENGRHDREARRV